VVTQVVPFPQDATVPVVARYHAAINASDPTAPTGFVSLEGYLAGRAIIAALGKIAGQPTRQTFVDAIQKGGPIDLGGFNLVYGDNNNAAQIKCFSQ